jgi:hypothetical protein
MFLGVMELRRSNPIEWQLTGSHFDLLIFRYWPPADRLSPVLSEDNAALIGRVRGEAL